MCETVNNNSERPSKDEWLMWMAEQVAERSTCTRKKVWCVLTKDWLIVSTWFNWVARWEAECPDQWCNPESSEHCHTIHAEVNAIINAARNWVSVLWCECYVTLKPCSDCTRVLINAWIKKVLYKAGPEKYEHGHNIKVEDYIETVKM